MADSLDKIGSAVGLSRPAMLAILDEVKANHATLLECRRHDFVSEDPMRLGAKWRCSSCGGHVSGNQAHWYNLGRSHD